MPRTRTVLAASAVIASLAILFVAWRALETSPATAASRVDSDVARPRSALDAPNAPPATTGELADTAEAPAREATSIAAVAVADEIEVAPGTISGRVRVRQKREPVAGARVRLVLVRGEMVELGVASTDDAGHYALVSPELALLSSVARCGARVVAYASADGYSTHREEQYVVSERNQVLDLDLTLVAGRSIRGRVVDSAGVPVAHAAISSWSAYPGSTTQSSDPQGFFCVGASNNARPARISVQHAIHGRALVTATFAGEATTVDVGDVVLRRYGTLAGRVVDAHAAPIGGFELRAVRVPESKPAGVDDQALRDAKAQIDALFAVRVDVEPPEPLFEGVGDGDAVTDTSGWFEIVGLCAGRYALHYDFPVGASTRVELGLTDSRAVAEFETGARDLELVAPGAFLLVQLVGDDGAPLPGIELAYAEIDDADAARGAPAPPEWRTITLDSADARVALPVRSPRVALHAEADGATTGERVVAVADSGVTRATLVLAPTRAHARIRARVAYPDGDECRDYTLTLRSPDTGVQLASFSWFDTDDEGWSPELPAGAFDYEITLGVGAASRHPNCVPIRARGLALAPGAQLELDAAFVLGGKLRVTATLAQADQRTRLGRAELFDATGRGVLLTCRPDPRRFGREPGPGELMLGQPEEFVDALAPGGYRLRVLAQGSEPAERTVTIAPAERTEVELELVPQSER